MANFIIEDLKKEWNKPENGLIKIILINVIIFISISIIKVLSQILGFGSLFLSFINSLMLPSDFKQFLFQPWSLISYFFLYKTLNLRTTGKIISTIIISLITDILNI